MNMFDQSIDQIDQKVFISYSRKDGLEFVEQLAAALEIVGVQPRIDRDSISGGEDWRERIGGLIAESDSVIFTITPESVASKICEWEIAKSDQLGKRIIPVVPAPLGKSLLPERLKSLNHIFFYPDASVPGAGFGKGLAGLSEALRTDLSWVRAHTRYGQRASEWLAGNRAANRLLSGSDVTTAKTWLAERRPGAPEITDEMRDFIKASEQAENERKSNEQKQLREKEETLAKMAAALEEKKLAQEGRDTAQRRATGFLMGGGLLALILALIAGYMWLNAYRTERRAIGFLDLLGWVGNKDLNKNLEPTEEQIRSMIELCNSAIKITKTIADNDNPDKEADIEKFWKLYNGPLYVVEQFQRRHFQDEENMIESNMVEFGYRLKGDRQGALVDAANGVGNACKNFQERLDAELSESSSDQTSSN
jgi:hypothetical protein